MNETTELWIKKAEGNYRVARREITVTTEPSYDDICFACHQAIEKLMKALLAQAGVTPPYTHDLAALSRLIANYYRDWDRSSEELDELTALGVELRYPGKFASRDQAQRAFALCAKFRERILSLFKWDE